MPTCTRPLTLASPALLLALIGGCDGPVRTEQLVFEETIRQIEIETGSGDIVVMAEPDRATIEVEAVIRGSATRLISKVEGDSLQLAHRCPPHIGFCSVDWYVWVPEQAGEFLDLELGAGSGDITVESVLGNVWASTGSGDVALREVTGFVIELEAGSGELLLDRCATDSIEASTGSGDVEASLRGDPRLVVIETGSGDVRLTVPGEGHRLDLDAGSGDIDVHGLEHDSNGDSLIAIRTGSGDIDVFGG